MDDKKVEVEKRLIGILKYMREEGIKRGKGIEEKKTVLENPHMRLFEDATIRTYAPQMIEANDKQQGVEIGE